ncbi:hypothetical protein P8C59_002742 [Phyllachora maydis]|uniref:Uncharacterized protein n=1 Tax=Phyllachora maydis TaxID=1825666 RepID=A0AAD9MCL8_9PEZI|nr:hypothetical protein P8C59_002742 [Phyllachora maydis]
MGMPSACRTLLCAPSHPSTYLARYVPACPPCTADTATHSAPPSPKLASASTVRVCTPSAWPVPVSGPGRRSRMAHVTDGKRESQSAAQRPAEPEPTMRTSTGRGAEAMVHY